MKKTDSPDEDKSVGDTSSLVPVLSDFFSLHPSFHPDTLLGDSSFDSAGFYGSLINDFHFNRALIPYNPHNESSLEKVGYNEYGYPTCPEDSSLAMKYCGVTREKGLTGQIKWGCPKIHMVKRAINHFKINMCIAGRRTRNHLTTKADVFLAGIASQLTVIVAGWNRTTFF